MGCKCSQIKPLPSSEHQAMRLHEKCLAKDEKSLFQTSETHGTEDTLGGSRIETLECFKASLTRAHYETMDEEDREALEARVEDYTFPFENLVFEGGGVKGLAFVGAIKCLEELGIRQQIRRFAGTSVGSIAAAMVAMGYHYDELEEFWSGDVESFFSDHSCGYLSFLPNIISKFGWNPGKKIMEYMGRKIAAKSRNKDPDMTFYDLYREMKVELCIVVTNVNQMSTIYCHPKTTPDMSIRKALRMSISVPGLFTAPRYNYHGENDVFVDGGALCNYPIHCFDGWFLSMAREDAFMYHFQSLKKLPELMANCNRFGTHNHKTLGFLLISDGEQEVLKSQFTKRQGAMLPTRPHANTKLYKKWKKTSEDLAKAEKEHCKLVEAFEAFMKTLQKYNLEELEYIDKEELKHVFNDALSKDKDGSKPAEFSKEQAEVLFCKGTDVNCVFDALDKNGDGKIALSELMHFIEERGIRLQVRFHGFDRREVNSFVQFLKAFQITLMTNMKYVHVKLKDVMRSVGINTDYIGFMDYHLDEADRQFAVARGYNATKAYLGYCVAWKYPGIEKKQTALGGQNG